MNNQINLTVNGKQQTLEAKPGETLSSLLRMRLHLTGTKIGCEEAECGACTVLVNGEPTMSCVYPAERADGKTIVTIEGLAERVHEEMKLHPLQEAFVEHGAVVCPAQAQPEPQQRRCPFCFEGYPLPLRGLSLHRECHPCGSASLADG